MMDFDKLKNAEFQEKLKAAESVEELVTLAKEQGVELSDEQLEAISGGKEWYEFCDAHAECRQLPHRPV